MHVRFCSLFFREIIIIADEADQYLQENFFAQTIYKPVGLNNKLNI